MSDPVIELKGLKKDYGNGRGAVSYTHLDVYKRQIPCCTR